MKSIQVKGHIKTNGILELCVPTGLLASDVAVVIVVQPIPGTDKQNSPEELGWPPEFFERTAGSLADDPMQRWPQEPKVNDG
jgi:hypothetical protein